VLERAQLAAGESDDTLLKALDAEQLDCISAQAYSRVPALKALIKELEADKENAAPVTPTLLCPVVAGGRKVYNLDYTIVAIDETKEAASFDILKLKAAIKVCMYVCFVACVL
jgi:hypothetical protein